MPGGINIGYNIITLSYSYHRNVTLIYMKLSHVKLAKNTEHYQ